MTPEKRQFYWKAAIFVGVSALLVLGYITQDAWLMVVMGS